MAVFGKCLIEISVKNRDTLIDKGARARAKSYDVVLTEIFKENSDLKETNDRLQKQNEDLQQAIVKISLSNGD